MNNKKDLTQFCRETNQTHQSVSESEFRSAWCKRCRNQECRYSQWGNGLWLNRMDTQVDRLLENPNFGDPRQEQFRFLQDILFEDMKHQAVAIHIGNMNEDWSVPTQEQVSDFLKEKPLKEDMLTSNGELGISDTYSEDTEEKVELIDPNDGLLPISAEPSIQEDPVFTKPNLPPMSNTPTSDMGIMIGDEPVVQKEESSPIVMDDWSVPPPVENLIPVGGKVVMGGNPKGDTKK